jgi:predicted dehydrogenase
MARKNELSSRRRFIAQSAAATASFAIVRPSAVRGSAANSRVEVGCIGLGGRGRLIAGMISEHEGFQITAAADYFPEVVQSIGEKLAVPGKRRSSGLFGYKELLAGKVDAVFCETPPCFFGEHVTAAVNAGSHVYLAKPVACDVPGCLAILGAAEKASRNNQVVLVDFQTRTEPFIIEAVKRVRSGLIGKLAMISSFYTDDGFSDPPLTDNIESRLQRLVWVNDITIGGGQLVAAGIHAIDVALWIAGAHPVSAVGGSRTTRSDPHGDAADVYSLTYQYENGLIQNHREEHLRNTHGFNCTSMAFGQDGHALMNYAGDVMVRGNKGGYRGGEVTNLYNNGIKRNLDTFCHSIVNGVYGNPTVEPSVNATLACILGREAGKRNTQLTWDELIRENKKVEVDLAGLTA